MPRSVDLRHGKHSRLVTVLSLMLLAAVLLSAALTGCGDKAGGAKKEVIVSFGTTASPTTASPTTTTAASQGTGTTAAPTTEETAATEVALDAEYRNDAWGYAVDYPQAWKLEEILDGHGCAVSDPAHQRWEITAWADPDGGKTPEQWLEEQYTMAGVVSTVERAPDTLTTGTFDDSHFAYDYWTSHVSADDSDNYYEILVADGGGNIYFVTAGYPVDDVKEAESTMVAILDSLTVFAGQEGGSDGSAVALGASYTNQAFAFSLSYPKDWKLEEMQDGSGCRISATTNDAALLVNVSVFGEDNALNDLPALRLEKYAELQAKGSGHPLDRDPSTLVTRTVDGVDYAIDHWISQSGKGATLKDYVMYATKSGRVFGFLASYPAALAGEVDPLVEAMIASFKPVG